MIQALRLPTLLLAAAALHAPLALAAGPAQPFQAASASLGADGAIPAQHAMNGFGCNGANRSPEVHWTGLPPGTRSLALTVHDPDAPTDSGWWHWVVLDIPASWKRIPQGAATSPSAGGFIQLRNDFGVAGWGGPCPPEGAAPHRYLFKLYAMPTAHAGLPANASAAMASYLLRAQALAVAEFVGTFGR